MDLADTVVSSTDSRTVEPTPGKQALEFDILSLI